jgi:hypothetical protein
MTIAYQINPLLCFFLHHLYACFTVAVWRRQYAQRLLCMSDTSIAHVPATTATMTATMTNVFASRNAATKALQYQLTRAQKTISPSILHPTKKAANYATPRYLLLIFVRNDTAL